jgi:ankyrin repeat protein
VVRLLLDAGEDANRYNPAGLHAHSVPLHQAVSYGHENVVRLLVEHGADTALTDTVYGGTPLDWANFAGRTEIAADLRARGAKSAEELER